jgi:hypothetical protein
VRVSANSKTKGKNNDDTDDRRRRLNSSFRSNEKDALLLNWDIILSNG